MESIRIAVTGLGYMGQLEARVCHAFEDFELVGLHNRTYATAEALGAELGAPAFETLDEMLDQSRPDALIVATPNHAHLEPVRAAAKRCIAVFLEKPMGLHVAECREMWRLMHEAAAPLFVGHTQRFMDGVRHVREAVRAKRIGRPVAMRAERTFWLDTDHEAPPWKTRKSQSGGHLFHHMHELDTARWILGDVTTVYGQMANLAHTDAGPDAEEDVVQVALRFEQGVLGTVELGSAYRTPNHFMRIDGSEGTAVIDWQHSTVRINTQDGTDERPMYDDSECQASALERYAEKDRTTSRVHGSTERGAPLFIRRLVEREFECFRHVVREETPPAGLEGLSEEDGIKAIEIAEAARLSEETRELIRLPLP